MNRIILSIAIAVSLFSCETVVTDDLNLSQSEPILVVEGGIEHYNDGTPSLQQVRLTTTTDFLENGPPPIVENAVVTLNTPQGVYPLAYVGEGFYRTTDIQAVVGENYELVIAWEGKQYTANDRLVEEPAIDSIYTEFEEETGITDEGYFVKINSQDPVDIPNFYHYRVYRNNELIVIPDPGNARTIILNDEFFDGENRVGVNPNEEAILEVGDSVLVEQIGISETYYDFLFELYTLTGNQGLSFTGNPPPASIGGNIQSQEPLQYKALGFFSVIDIKRKSILVVE